MFNLPLAPATFIFVDNLIRTPDKVRIINSFPVDSNILMGTALVESCGQQPIVLRNGTGCIYLQ